MNQENQNLNNSKNGEEVDLIQLLNYFKNGIISIFRGIGKIFSYLFYFIFLLRKYWILTGGLVLLGIFYGAFITPMLKDTDVKIYEMVVKASPVANLELYAFGEEVNIQKSESVNQAEKGIQLAKSLGISKISIEPIEREEDVINNYFEQIEVNTLRGIETDTLFFQDYKLSEHKSKMTETDFAFQKIQIKVKNDHKRPIEIQEQLFNYLNNLPSIKNDQEARLMALTNYEHHLKRTLGNIDSIMYSKAVANKNSTSSEAEQLLVNTASRGTVEADLLRYTESFSKKLYGTQKMIKSYQNGVNIVSNLRSAKEEEAFGGTTLRYAILGFVLASLVILGIQFNKFLNKYERENL